MRSFRSVVVSMLCVLALGCGLPPPGHTRAVEAATTSVGKPLTTCVVATPEGVIGMAAHRDGVVFIKPSTANGNPSVRAERSLGIGCELTAQPSAPVALESLLDVDDRGNLYGFPAEGQVGEVSTMLPDEYPGSMVAKVDAAGKVTKLVAAGRGIWSFGVSPEGGSMWMTACGPTGVLSTADATQTMPPPETLWAQYPSVLTNDATFWSLGYGTCNRGEARTPDCGFPLVRTTLEGSQEVAATIVDFGAGYEESMLARCGTDVCGVFKSAVIVWDDAGKPIRTILLSEIASPSESIAQVSGNQHGVYVLLEGAAGARIVFVPAQREGHTR